MAGVRVRSHRNVTIVVDTSTLDNIIRANQGKPTKYIIADGVEYGVYVELGTSRMAARPCLVPAFNKIQFGIPPAIRRAIEKMIDPYTILKKAAFDIQALYQQTVPVDTGALKNSIHVETE